MLNQEIDRYKKAVLLLLLKLTIIAGLIFPIINIQRGLFLFAMIEIVATLLTLGVYLGVRNTVNQKKIDYFSLAYTLMFFSILMIAFSTNGISKSIFIWVFTIPMISYLLLGMRNGFIVTVIFYILSAILLFDNYNLQEFDKITIANIIIAAVGFWGLSHTYEKANFLTKQKLNKMAIYDKLTGLYNRTMLNQIFSQTVSQAQIEKQQISFIAFDLDLFKGINDQFGHVVGDEILIEFSNILRQSLPKKAFAFGLGGEEFAVIFPCDTLSQAKELAESLRQKTEDISHIHASKPVHLTVSAGIVIDGPEDANLNNMLKVSDKRLYQARSQGRNRVVSQ